MRMYVFNKDASCQSLPTISLKLDSVACFPESLWDFSEQLFPWAFSFPFLQDIMMKMVPQPLPSLISLVVLWLFYLSLLFWLKFERTTYNVLRYKSYGIYKSLVMKFSHLVFDKVDVIFLQEGRNYNWQWLTSQQPTFYHHLFFFL